MTQVVEVDAGQAGLGDGGQPRAAVEVAVPQRRTHRAGEHKRLVVVRVESLVARAIPGTGPRKTNSAGPGPSGHTAYGRLTGPDAVMISW
jgi:hypothetical protein